MEPQDITREQAVVDVSCLHTEMRVDLTDPHPDVELPDSAAARAWVIQVLSGAYCLGCA